MAEQTNESKCVLAIRIRGTVSASKEAREALRMLHLERNNHGVLIDNRPSFLGMMKTVRDYVTYGEVSKESVASLIKKKGRLIGNKRMTDEYAQKVGHKSLEELADAVSSCRVEFWKLRGVQPGFQAAPSYQRF